MKIPAVRPVRCAIYTRVSTDHGLDQEFNSLDAQYDAASAYIKSQAHAGWTLIRSRYDDGGYSGGSTDRPDLQKLLDDIRARKLYTSGHTIPLNLLMVFTESCPLCPATYLIVICARIGKPAALRGVCGIRRPMCIARTTAGL